MRLKTFSKSYGMALVIKISFPLDQKANRNSSRLYSCQKRPISKYCLQVFKLEERKRDLSGANQCEEGSRPGRVKAACGHANTDFVNQSLLETGGKIQRSIR